MRIALLALCLAGCASTSASLAPVEPIGMKCTPAQDVCGEGMHCVVAKGAPDGVCSRSDGGRQCLNTHDCEDGAYCHKTPTTNGICFRP